MRSDGPQQSVTNDFDRSLMSYVPAIFAIAAPLLLLLLRIMTGGEGFISDPALMILALAAYLVGAVFLLTDIYAPFAMAEKLGLWAAAFGTALNFASWLLRWAAAYERELAIFTAQGTDLTEMPWIFRYVPFANLYDLSLAFAFGAGITTLLVMRRKDFRGVALLTLPMAALILVLARFIGGELIDLPPVLDSYWRPIHVGIASISYGIALVCFAVAVLYLVKDGVRVEKMAIWIGLFSLAVYASIGNFIVFSPRSFGTFAASTSVGEPGMWLALRADIPYAGWLVVGAAAFVVAAIAAFSVSLVSDKDLVRWGRRSLVTAMILNAAAVAVLIYQLNTMQDVASYVRTEQYANFAVWMLQKRDVPQPEIDAMADVQLFEIADKWVAQNGADLRVGLSGNPVELAALVTACAGMCFVLLFGTRPERIRSLLPSTEMLDGLMYRLGGTTFAGLALLLITGAVWANESWGRYWGWDSKEVGALIAWLAYAGFLHSRITHGWRGRRSAYFAIVAFLFIIFTYLGVSYLLPGLHSYA